ncbi:hypothetical protein [Nonomuraea sp. NPDC050310]|uniref:hypothetical protein n=1 Tax=Nonomuraea sp. NPDC050310 TaxID=3154935 RepID=UPI0033E72865
MAKFDGMDPKLVRELLAEVRQAAVQMRQIEGRVAQVMGAAGLATQTTHRPAQVAEACDGMVRDVTARLTLLEKREDAGTTTPPTGTQQDTSGKPDSGAKPETEDKPDAEDKPEVGDKPEAGDKPAPSESATTTPATPETKPAQDGNSTTPPPKAMTGSESVSGAGEELKKAAPVSGTTTPSDAGKPQIVEVDGVKVVQIPLDSTPTAKEIADLLDKAGQVEPADQPGKTDDGDVVSVEATRPSDAKLAELGQKISEIPPMEMPGVEVPKGEWGKGEWVPESVKPDGAAGAVDPGGPATQAATSGGPVGTQAASAGDVQQWASDGSDVVSVEATRPSDAKLAELGQNISEIPPMEMPGVEVPKGEWGKGEWVPESVKPDGSAGAVDPGGPATQAATSGGPVETTGGPSATSGGPVGTQAASAGDVQQWASDGSDVVSVEATRPSDAKLAELAENISEIPPMEMPSVEVPKGEWGKGEWAPEEIGPDGPAGSVKPGGPA